MTTEHALQTARRRTFAIVSHPDAGKTTLTEKLLLFGGAIQMAGSVKGRKAARHATSDWMALEKERGISVTSSVMQFPYEGCIVNLLDIFAERPKPAHTLYGMAKAAQGMLTKSLALELAPDVRVNAIAPGAILWPESGKSDTQKQAILDATPLARIGEVADICKAVRFLIEDATYCTGQILAVDGGRLLR